jgi:hypothetical protein
VFRSTMYPSESLGLLRLHSTYRHDLKIYSSDEGRVQMTAAAFTKGLLDLEGELTPILASLVRAFNTNAMLDDTLTARDMMEDIKRRLKATITRQVVVRDKPASTDVPAPTVTASALPGQPLGTIIDDAVEVDAEGVDSGAVAGAGSCTCSCEDVGVAVAASPQLVDPVPSGIASVGGSSGSLSATSASGYKRQLASLQTIEEIIDEIVPMRPLAAMKCLEVRASSCVKQTTQRCSVTLLVLGLCCSHSPYTTKQCVASAVPSVPAADFADCA